MSSQVTGVGTSSEGEFGANEWLVDELYEQFKVDKHSVDKAWWPILEAYHPVVDGSAAAAPPPSPSAQAAPTEPKPVTAPIPVVGQAPVARTTAKPAKPQPIPA